ncbi:MAG: hypothetical protein JNL21_35490 [Myxococcales bacterium]|nr:hypothetical protein [Myxococcales bacterium]
MTYGSLAAATRLLARIEELASDATGALVFASRTEPVGTILLEGGRICWIGAKGLGRRLTDLLTERSGGLGREQVEDVFGWCSRTGSPLGEALIESGLLGPDGLREALSRHSAESLLLIAPHAEQVQWLSHKHRRYDARFTFRAFDLLLAAGAATAPELAATATAHLERILRGGGAGIALARDDAEKLVCVGGLRCGDWSVTSVERLASYAGMAVDLADFVAPSHEAMAVGQPSGASLTIWRHDEIVYVAVGADTSLLPLKVASLSGTFTLLRR